VKEHQVDSQSGVTISTSTGQYMCYSGLCSYTTDSSETAHNHHMETMANTLAAPIAASYCLTIIVIAVAILSFLSARYQHMLDMEECASGERENADDNKRIIECAKAGVVERESE
jgi:multisubunit Na+/H+ antiporter MnhC subunit